MGNNKNATDNLFNSIYNSSENLFGYPYQELQIFFKNYSIKGTLLDLGCGQGRDAIYLSSIGYKVTAVDSSTVGISQMLTKANQKGLDIKGIVADVYDFSQVSNYDIILFDMLLHSFDKNEQTKLLNKYSSFLNGNGIFSIVYPIDFTSDYFMQIFKGLSKDWVLKTKTIIKNVPKLNDEDNYTFEMIIVGRN